MAKVIFTIIVDKVCKIVLSDEKMAEIKMAQEFIVESKWPGNVKVPIDVLVYKSGDVDEDHDYGWESFASIFSNGELDIMHEWYEGDESYINHKNLCEIDDLYINPELISDFANSRNWQAYKLDTKSFYRLADKKDINIIKKAIMQRKLAGEEVIDYN